MALSGGGQSYKFYLQKGLANMTIEISVAIVISFISLSFSVYMGLKGNKRTDTKDIEERTKERTELNVQLRYITQNTQDIKEQINSLMRDVQKHGDRITQMEGNIKHTADYLEKLHTRITSLEERVTKVERDDED